MSDSPQHIEYLELIVKDLSGELTSDEQLRLKTWIDSSDKNRRIYDEYLKVWKEMEKVEGRNSKDVDEEWAKLEKVIDEEDTSIKKEKPSPFIRIAATVVMLLTAGLAIYFVLNNNKSEVILAEHQVKEISLPEGSKVSLNLESRISYPKEFKSDTREVALEGEAFFEVARDTIRPFIIKTGELNIEVLGTSFNVKAYEIDETVEVTVESGKVAVYRIGNKSNMVILVRGEKAVFKKELTELESMKNEDINYKSWKTRKIIFEDTPMSEVVRMINEIYQSDLQLSGSNLNDCPVTTMFDNQSLETILNVLSSTLDLEITREGDRIIISGAGC